MSSAESDVYARFDLIVTALDEAYQRSTQIYRNWTRALAAGVAIALALAGGNVLGIYLWLSLLIGLLATPLAPIAKDISSALATGSQFHADRQEVALSDLVSHDVHRR